MKTTTVLVLYLTASVIGFSPQDVSSCRRDFLSSSVAGVLTTVTVVAPANAVVKGSAPQGTALGKIDKNSAVGKEIESWNSLIYNFKNNRLDGGLDASKLKEPSIPFTEFGEKLKNGEVTFVEFMAPNGDVAYATIKTGDSKNKKNPKTKRIRSIEALRDTASYVNGVKGDMVDHFPIGLTERQVDSHLPNFCSIGQGYPTTSKNSWSSPAYVIRAVSNYGVPYYFSVPALDKYKKTAQK
eukprot:scaffold4097_cov166-Amphora_coffeaeformis.AAC.57